MAVWDSYPNTYRATEVQRILTAVQAGECVSILGLSGAGKSNLVSFLAHRVSWPGKFVLVDCNQLFSVTAHTFFQLITQALSGNLPPENTPDTILSYLSSVVDQSPTRVCLLLDRFDAFTSADSAATANILRSLRDQHKYHLTYVTATRRPLDPNTELAELFFANTFWLGPLQPSDTTWNVKRFTARKGLLWQTDKIEVIQALTWGYPAFVRSVLEAHASGCPLEIHALLAHPIVQRRISEFWKDHPTPEMLASSGLTDHPLLSKDRPTSMVTDDIPFDLSRLTAKEHLLFTYFQAHPGMVCEKDTLIQAVWPEDQVFEAGIRDDSLAQLVRRLRKKIEPDPANPTWILTVSGRGYRYRNPR